MLKDVKDLRSTKWVSRRISDAPKKIAEIHAEVKQEEMQMQLAHQQAAQKRMMNKTGMKCFICDIHFCRMLTSMCSQLILVRIRAVRTITYSNETFKSNF